MSRKTHHDLRKVSKATEGVPFIQLTAELISSPAWRYRSINVGRLLDLLIIEHLNHAGRENGNLSATYDQLVAFGISRRLVAKTIDEAEQLNLIEVHRFPRKTFTEAYPLRFRLTFLPAIIPLTYATTAPILRT